MKREFKIGDIINIKDEFKDEYRLFFGDIMNNLEIFDYTKLDNDYVVYTYDKQDCWLVAPEHLEKAKKLTQKERILEDLLNGVYVNMLSNVKRYGTSCRSRIAELRAEGYHIEDYFVGSGGGSYKVYFIPKEKLEENK